MINDKFNSNFKSHITFGGTQNKHKKRFVSLL